MKLYSNKFINISLLCVIFMIVEPTISVNNPNTNNFNQNNEQLLSLNPNYSGNHSAFNSKKNNNFNTNINSNTNSNYNNFNNQDSVPQSNYPLFTPPPKIPILNNEDETYKDEYYKVAERMVENYRKMFDFIDENSNNLVTDSELSIAFDIYNWPKDIDGNIDNIEYSKDLISKFDRDSKNGVTFEEFCNMIGSMYDVRDNLEEQKCLNSYEKAVDVLNNFYRWLDQTGTGNVGESELLFGISKMMGRDADESEISNVLKKNGGKLSNDGLILAIANGDFDKTFINPNYSKDSN